MEDVSLKEFDIPCSSDSDNDASDTQGKHIETELKLEHDGPSRTRTYSKVSFTIGDSSDCDSFSTSSSVARDHPVEFPNGMHSEGGDINWHKYHFHNGESVDGTRDCDHGQLSADSPYSLRFSPPTSGGMVPNSADFNSIARLADVEDTGESGNDGGISCFNKFVKWRVLIAFAISNFCSALTVSLQSPFYPQEAEKKGASATEYGLVFGVFELTVFIVAPIYGYKIEKWNPKLVFNVGILVTAISSIVFGLLDTLDNGTYFIAACAVVRVLEAVGESALVTSSFVIVASIFPDSVATTSAVLETFYSIGLLSGPLVGSVFYQLGGYSLPFLIVGGSLLTAALLTSVILPSSGEISAFHPTEQIVISSYKSFKLLKSSGIVVSAICIFTASMSIAYLQATLEPHLRQFGISQLTIGAILIINGGIYTLTAPFWGLLCDKVLQLKVITFAGAAVLLCGFSVIGPVPIFPFKPKLWIISLGLAVQGLGLGGVLVSSFLSILRNAFNLGYPDSPSTYGLVTSLWASMFSLGAFVGPTLSGILYDAVGFGWGTLSVISVLIIMMCILLMFVCASASERKSFLGSENEPLLNGTTGLSASIYSGETNPSPPTPSLRPNTNQGNSYGAVTS